MFHENAVTIFVHECFMFSIWDSCEADAGWMGVVELNDQMENDLENICSWCKWWENENVQTKFHPPPTVDQPPYILYSSLAGGQISGEWEVGGKLEIYVL